MRYRDRGRCNWRQNLDRTGWPVPDHLDILCPARATDMNYVRGWPVFNVGGRWVYADGEAYSESSERPCKRCGQPATGEGYDHCLGHVPGAVSACCGHGVTEPICIMEGGLSKATKH